MAEYVLAFKEGHPPATPEDGQVFMKAWGDWLGKLGDKIVNPGSPLGTPKALSTDGSVAEGQAAMNGYAIIKAGSMDEAVELAKACPIFTLDASMDIYEALDPQMSQP